MAPKRLVVVGSLNMDLVVRAARIPAPGETTLGREFREIPGGKGANQAVAAARLGAACSMIGCVGADTFGGALCGGLATAGVNIDAVRSVDSARTGVALIVVDETGHNAICVAPGANHALTPEDVGRAAEHIRRADALLVQFEVPMPTVAAAVRQARAGGAYVVVNPAPAADCPEEVLAADLLAPNASEAATLTGMAVVDPDSAIRAGRILLQKGAKAVVVTLGAQGCVWVEQDAAEAVPAFRVPVADTTAAGDAFVAAIALARAEGREPSEAIRRACAAGALTCTRRGAQPSLPSLREVEALLARG